jgi:hypothetical protein
LKHFAGYRRQRRFHGSEPPRHIFKYNADEKIELLQAVLGGRQSGRDLAGRNKANLIRRLT